MTGRRTSGTCTVLLAAATLVVACRTGRDSRPVIVQPAAPGGTSRIIDARQATDLSKVRFSAADVRFMSGMIGHHEQAVEMVALIPDRTEREPMRLLGLRIDLSQSDEIRMMERWLADRGLPVPDVSAHQHHAMMPGMLSEEDMAALAAAKGDDFDRLFLEGMIKHHRGALTMVEELFASAGAAQETEIYGFASDVDADQRMEIDRMGAMLQELHK